MYIVYRRTEYGIEYWDGDSWTDMRIMAYLYNYNEASITADSLNAEIMKA